HAPVPRREWAQTSSCLTVISTEWSQAEHSKVRLSQAGLSAAMCDSHIAVPHLRQLGRSMSGNDGSNMCDCGIGCAL
ncbi:MAG: hypothetical protein WBX35_20170, partial [Pseudolabrys sp.]